jgi:hypothetical protein
MEQRFDRVLLVLTAIALLCNAATWALLLWKIPYTEETIFLHYNVYFGIDLTGGWKQLFWVPGSGTVILVINTAVLYAAKQMHRMTKITTGILTVAFEAMLIVAAILIILLNIS